MTARAVIFGCIGPRLGADEAAFFRDADPLGFILFARNLDTAEQIRALTADLRESVGWDAPILIDQEGGRVDRFEQDIITRFPPALDQAQSNGDIDRAAQVMGLRAAITAVELAGLGIDVNCTPVLDLVRDGTHPVLANRCLGSTPTRVARLGRAMAEAMLAEGALPVIKHMPGHGRSTLDTHHALPTLEASLETLERTDFAPFRALNDMPMGMTGHLLIPALDPEQCATLSPAVIGHIRDSIGFDGLLLTDDFSMGALSGDMGTRAGQALGAGCDVILHCNGERDEMAALADTVPTLTADGVRRADAALALRHGPKTPLRELHDQLKRLEDPIHA